MPSRRGRSRSCPGAPRSTSALRVEFRPDASTLRVRSFSEAQRTLDELRRLPGCCAAAGGFGRRAHPGAVHSTAGLAIAGPARKARFLAIANSTRAAAIPDVPTAREAGHPELAIDGLSGLFGWRGMPDALRRRIAADVTAVMSDPDIHRRIEATGQVVIGGTPAQFESAIAEQRSFIAEVAKLIELKPAK